MMSNNMPMPIRDSIRQPSPFSGQEALHETAVLDCDKHYEVWAHVGTEQNWFLSTKHGWLPAHRQNVRFFSRFKTLAGATRALDNAPAPPWKQYQKENKT